MSRLHRRRLLLLLLRLGCVLHLLGEVKVNVNWPFPFRVSQLVCFLVVFL